MVHLDQLMTTFGPARHHIGSCVLWLSSGCGSEGGHFGACRVGKSKEKTEWNLWAGGQLALIVCVQVSVFAVDGVWCLGVSNEHLKRFCQLESKPGRSQHFPFPRRYYTLGTGPGPILLFPPFLLPQVWQIDGTQTGEEAILYWVRLSAALHRSRPVALPSSPSAHQSALARLKSAVNLPKLVSTHTYYNLQVDY